MEKKRIIVDYSTLPKEILEILSEKYPDGYDHDIIKFPNSKGELISAVRVETDTIIYLVKISKQLREMVDDYDDEDDDDDERDVSTTLAKSSIPKGVIPDDEFDDNEDEDTDDDEFEFDEDDMDEED